jgi:hypothetical protein
VAEHDRPVQRWLAALPAELVGSRPRLLLAQARLALLSGDLKAVEAPLDATERAVADAAEASIAFASRALAEVGDGEWNVGSLSRAAPDVTLTLDGVAFGFRVHGGRRFADRLGSSWSWRVALARRLA